MPGWSWSERRCAFTLTRTRKENGRRSDREKLKAAMTPIASDKAWEKGSIHKA